MLALGEAGYKEVTLLGQNIDAYGRDLEGMAEDGTGRRAWTFTDLLRYVHDVPGIQRIRFATSHPRYFTGRRGRPGWGGLGQGAAGQIGWGGMGWDGLGARLWMLRDGRCCVA